LILALLVALAACGDETQEREPAQARAVATLIDNRVEDDTESDLESLNGLYGAGCGEHTGAWSLALTTTPVALDNAPLSIATTEPACALIITSVKTSAGTVLEAQTQAALSDEYADEPVAFGNPAVFYANTKVDTSALVTGTFEISLVYSDDVSRAAPAPSSVSYYASSGDTSVPPPDYQLNASGLTLEVDASELVLTVGGSAILTEQAVAGVGYAIAMGKRTSYAEIDATYVAARRPMALQIPASEFGLIGLTLSAPQVRTLIVANLVNGVRSYEVFTLAFGTEAK
jgi:hypothetical protein